MSDLESWDVVVVGAGPAGATAALAAIREAPSARVLLLDRADFPRDKCCGDGIAPHVLDVLAPLGAADVVDGWTPVGRLELARRRRVVAGDLARPVWVVPREVFDARLVDRAVEAGAVLRTHRVRDVRVTDGVVLDGSIRAAVVVGADGAHSVVRGGAGQGAQPRQAFALRGYVATPAGREGRQVIRYGERRQPSYAWSFDRGDGFANVGYGELVGAHEQPSRELLMRELEELLPGSVPDGFAWRGHHLPLSGWGSSLARRGRILLAGDAAGLINPMTGEGIYYAVATGALAGRSAARAVTQGRPQDAGRDHARAVRRLLDRHLHHTWAAARLSRSPAVVEAGIGAARRDRRSFDTLVELGLGDGRITPRLAVGLGLALASPPHP